MSNFMLLWKYFFHLLLANWFYRATKVAGLLLLRCSGNWSYGWGVGGCWLYGQPPFIIGRVSSISMISTTI